MNRQSASSVNAPTPEITIRASDVEQLSQLCSSLNARIHELNSTVSQLGTALQAITANHSIKVPASAPSSTAISIPVTAQGAHHITGNDHQLDIDGLGDNLLAEIPPFSPDGLSRMLLDRLLDSYFRDTIRNSVPSSAHNQQRSARRTSFNFNNNEQSRDGRNFK